MKYDKKISVCLTAEQYQKIKILAGKSLRTKSGYIRQIVRTYLRHIEQHPEQELK